jgi:predicted transcriptional regulator
MSVRLDKETESELEKTASLLHTTKSKVVKQSLREYCSRVLEEKRKHPYELIEDLLEREGSGRGDLSVRGEEILREVFSRRKR